MDGAAQRMSEKQTEPRVTDFLRFKSMLAAESLLYNRHTTWGQRVLRGQQCDRCIGVWEEQTPDKKKDPIFPDKTKCPVISQYLIWCRKLKRLNIKMGLFLKPGPGVPGLMFDLSLCCSPWGPVYGGEGRTVQHQTQEKRAVGWYRGMGADAFKSRSTLSWHVIKMMMFSWSVYWPSLTPDPDSIFLSALN